MHYFCLSLLLCFSTVSLAAVHKADQFIVDGVPHEVDSSPLEKLYAADAVSYTHLTLPTKA